jgi:hypothetical protein
MGCPEGGLGDWMIAGLCGGGEGGVGGGDRGEDRRGGSCREVPPETRWFSKPWCQTRTKLGPGPFFHVSRRAQPGERLSVSWLVEARRAGTAGESAYAQCGLAPRLVNRAVGMEWEHYRVPLGG